QLVVDGVGDGKSYAATGGDGGGGGCVTGKEAHVPEPDSAVVEDPTQLGRGLGVLGPQQPLLSRQPRHLAGAGGGVVGADHHHQLVAKKWRGVDTEVPNLVGADADVGSAHAQEVAE